MEKYMKKYYSPTQVNKFVNCNYQWYYEQKYTKKELNDLYAKYKKDNNITTDSQFYAFQYGNKFHDSYMNNENRKVYIQSIILILAVMLGVYIWKFII